MCHVCVIENVKSNMLSRRAFFRGTGAVAAGAAIASTGFSARPALAQGTTRAEDLTHELYEEFPTFFGDQQLFIEQKFSFAQDTFNLNEWRINEHTGTHVDAPLHFSADGRSVAEIPVEDLICPLVIVDIREKAEADADAQVTPSDIEAWVFANGELPDGACVAMFSGWGKHLHDDRFRNADADGTMHFPGFHIEAAQMLIEAGNVKAIAVDTLSLDYGMSPDFAVHNEWLPSGRYGIEGIANLGALPVSGATLIVGAPKVRGGTGGPARVFAMV
ncbi:cyclase family protein [Aliihoeflea sp. PC F10.4]